jgi:hypothetical protein
MPYYDSQGDHLKISYDSQGDAEDLSWPRSSQVPYSQMQM